MNGVMGVSLRVQGFGGLGVLGLGFHVSGSWESGGGVHELIKGS